MRFLPHYFISALIIVAILAAWVGLRNTFPIEKFSDDFLEDPELSGWVPSETGTSWQKDVGITVEGEGRWESPKFRVTPYEWLRAELMTTATSRALWAVVFEDEHGMEMDSDCYSSVDASKVPQTSVFHVRVKAGAQKAWLRLQSPDPLAAKARLEVKKVVVEEATRKQVLAWADALSDAMPEFRFSGATDFQSRLPNTFAALKQAQTLRVVLLGDSIMNDIGNSPLDILIEQDYPGARLEIVTSVRSGTGMKWYQHESRVIPYVLEFEPDLVMIGGISHGFDVEAIGNVIRQIREQSDAEIILLTGPVGPRSPQDKKDSPGAADTAETTYAERLQTLADESGAGFYNLERAWDAYVLASGQPYDWFLRDWLHANTRGRQVLARAMAAAFRPVGASTPSAVSSTEPPMMTLQATGDAPGEEVSVLVTVRAQEASEHIWLKTEPQDELAVPCRKILFDQAQDLWKIQSGWAEPEIDLLANMLSVLPERRIARRESRKESRKGSGL